MPSCSWELSEAALLGLLLNSESLNKFISERNEQKVRSKQRWEGEQSEGKEQRVVRVLPHQVINGSLSSSPSIGELSALAERPSGSGGINPARQRMENIS